LVNSRRGTELMSKWSNATRLGALLGAAALLGGLALSAAGSGGVHAQTGTATPAATVAATASGPTPASNVGGPSSVPSARFFGTVTAAGGTLPGTVVTASIGGVLCGSGTVSGNQYTVDVQAIQGCTTAGASVSFTVGGMAASPSGSLPAVAGTAVQNNLTVAAPTPTPAPTVASTPPPPPTRVTTPPPPPTARPSATTRATPAATAAQGQRPSAPAAQKPAAAPAAQKPVAAAPARGAVVLPNTGSGTTSGQSSTSVLALFSILAGAGLLGASSLLAFRKSR
jgi:hypothetical protein